MSECMGWIVRSKAGHDKDTLFCVVGEAGEHLLLANGKQRKISAPKRKKRCHVEIVETQPVDQITQRLRHNEIVFDSQLRRTLAAFKGGNHAWQKTI